MCIFQYQLGVCEAFFNMLIQHLKSTVRRAPLGMYFAIDLRLTYDTYHLLETALFAVILDPY